MNTSLKRPFFSRDKGMYKAFFIMTLSIALQNLIVYGTNLADNVMIGKWQTILSGIALVNQIQFLLQMAVNGVAEGMVVIASRSWGRKDFEGIKNIISIGMRIALGVALIMWFFMFFFTKEVLGIITNEPAVIEEGVKYAKIVCFSYIFFAITNVLTAAMRSVESVKPGIYVSVTALVVNVILNYVFINGFWFIPQMKGVGAAIATLISRIVEMLVIICYVAFRDKKIKLRLRDFGRFDRAIFRVYLKVGSPCVISGTMWGFIQLAQTAILGHLGEDVIAANSIAATVFSIVTVAVYGSSSASSVIIGKALGEGKKHEIKGYTHSMQFMFVGIGLVTSLVLFSCKNLMVSFYTLTPEAADYTLTFIKILSVTVIGTSYQMSCLSGICRGGGDTTSIMINDFISLVLIVLPLSYCAAFIWKLSPVIVFFFLKSDQLFKGIFAAIRTNSYKWIKDVGVNPVEEALKKRELAGK